MTALQTFNVCGIEALFISGVVFREAEILPVREDSTIANR